MRAPSQSRILNCPFTSLVIDPSQWVTVALGLGSPSLAHRDCRRLSLLGAAPPLAWPRPSARLVPGHGAQNRSRSGCCPPAARPGRRPAAFPTSGSQLEARRGRRRRARAAAGRPGYLPRPSESDSEFKFESSPTVDHDHDTARCNARNAPPFSQLLATVTCGIMQLSLPSHLNSVAGPLCQASSCRGPGSGRRRGWPPRHRAVTAAAHWLKAESSHRDVTVDVTSRQVRRVAASRAPGPGPPGPAAPGGACSDSEAGTRAVPPWAQSLHSLASSSCQCAGASAPAPRQPLAATAAADGVTAELRPAGGTVRRRSR